VKARIAHRHFELMKIRPTRRGCFDGDP